MTGATKRATEWFTPPPDKSAYAPSPHVAPDFYSLLSQTERILIEWFKQIGKRQENQSWVCGQWSYAKIAREVKLHWTTVRRAVASLKAKQSLDTRDVWSHDKKGGRRVGTLYTVPSYTDSLARRRAIPGVALTAVGHVICIGRAKRIMTREMAAEWQIDLAKAPRSDYSKARRTPTIAEAAATAAASQQEAPAAPANGPPAEEQPPTTMTKPDPLPREVHRALKECVRQRMFSRGVAERLVLNARKIALQRGMTLTDEDIVTCIYAGWDAARKDVQSIAFYNTALPEKVNAMLDERADRIAAWKQAGGTCPDCGGSGTRRAVVRGVGYSTRCDCTPLETFKQLMQNQQADGTEEKDSGHAQRAAG